MYRPERNYSGSDEFAYQLCDTGGLCAQGLITVDVTAVNDLILAAAEPSGTVAYPVFVSGPSVAESVASAAREAAEALAAPLGLLTLLAGAAIAKGSAATGFTSLLGKLLQLLAR